MPRVLLVFEPPDGGVADSARLLALGLRAHGWEPVLAGPDDSTVVDAAREAGIPYHRPGLARGFGRPARDAKVVGALTRLVAETQPDLAHLMSSKAGVVGRAAALRTRTPWLYSPHCFSFVGPVGLPRKAFGLGVELALGRPGKGTIVCVCDDERREALTHRVAPAERVVRIHNGCATAPEGLEPDPELAAFAAGGPTAATLAALRPQKAHHLLLEAAPRILEAVPGARLAVIGDGEERDALEARCAALGLDDRVRLFGFRAPAFRQLAALDVFLLPSLWEAFPFAVLEALAAGVPQVASDVGGTREALAHGVTGLLVPPGDADALAAATIELLRDPARRAAMARASVARHAAHFRLEAMVEAHARLYDRVHDATRSAA